MFHSSGGPLKHRHSRRNHVSILLTVWVISTSGFRVAILVFLYNNVDPQHPAVFPLSNYTKWDRYSDFFSTSTVCTPTVRIWYFRFHVRHLDFRQNDTEDFFGDGTIEKPTPENMGVDTKIMFLSCRIAEIEGVNAALSRLPLHTVGRTQTVAPPRGCQQLFAGFTSSEHTLFTRDIVASVNWS